MARRPNLDMDVLRTFVTGFELGSFARAADRLGRSQSAISTQLRKLEEQMGQPLVRKSGRGLLPTPAGERLLALGRLASAPSRRAPETKASRLVHEPDELGKAWLARELKQPRG